jgi:chemotaxis protein MotB
MSDEDDAPSGDSGGGGAPGWIVTFSDLMSLLLAFFVLLFAMSSTDSQKFQLMGGSLSEAFGVQRLMVLNDPVMGINHIATEFSAGRPDMSTLNVIPQDQLLLILRYLTNEPPINAEKESGLGPTDSKDDVHGLKTVQEDAEDRYQFDQSGKSKEEVHEAQLHKDVSEESKQEQEKKSTSESQSAAEEIKELAKKLKESGKLDNSNSNQNAENIDKNKAKEDIKGKKEAEQEIDAQDQVLKKFPKQGDSNKEQLVNLMEGEHQLREKLAEEVQNGFIDIETEGGKLIIRINENGSFPSGSANVSPDALPIIKEIAETLKEVQGDIVVAGHTDNIPTVGGEFKSNWELSSARAVSMVEEIMRAGDLKKRNFKAEAYADTKPRETNETVAGRARNRRVEIIVEQQSQKIDKSSNKSKKNKKEENHADVEEQRMKEQLNNIFGGLPDVFE